MTPTPDNLLSAEDVMNRIRRRIGLDVGEFSGEAPKVAAPPRTGLVPRVHALRPPPPLKQEYSLSELLPYDDGEFVAIAYQILLGRGTDDHAYQYLQALREGGLTKVEVLGAIRWSPEGVRRGVHVDGLLIPYKLRRWRRLPFIGAALGWGLSILQLSRLFDRQTTHTTNVAACVQQTASTLNAITDELEGRLRSIEHVVDGLPGIAVIDDLRTRLNLLSEKTALLDRRAGEVEAAMADELEGRLRSIENIVDRLTSTATVDDLRSRLDLVSTSVTLLDRRHDEVERLISGLDARMQTVMDDVDADRLAVATLKDGLQPASRDVGLDGLYAALEDQFRGERELVRQRVVQYIDFVQAVEGGSPEAPVLDLGCGRGEWLELLRERGFIAKGVDLNTVFIESCRSRGLHVIEGDAINTMRGMGDGSVGLVSLIHLAEHLEFRDLVELFDEAYRVLKPGGGLIVETPNPESALVSRIGFYMDPTHRNPLPPEMLRWLIQTRGFFSADIARLTQGRAIQVADYVADDVPGAAAINELLAPSHATLDYAVLARKAAEA